MWRSSELDSLHCRSSHCWYVSRTFRTLRTYSTLGLGAAGVFSGAIPIFMYILPLEKRPAWTGLFGMVFGIASVAGPLLGGLFTDNVSWRWCFYINLPIGAVTFAIIFLILHLPEQKREELTVKQQIDRLDPVGTLVFFGSIVCLLLALQ